MRLRWLSVVAGLGLGLSSCSFDDGGVQPDGSGAVDASVDAEPPVCVPGCEGDILVTCPAGGAQRTECDLGCVADDDPHCGVMVPSNGVTVGDLDVVPADKPFVVPAGAIYTIDTDSGRIVDEDSRTIRPPTTGGGVHEGTGTFYSQRGGAVGLFAVDALTIEAGGVLQGEGDRALIIFSRGDIVLRGTIDFSAGCRSGLGDGVCGGPGGGAGVSVGSTTAGGCGPGGNGAGVAGGGEAGAESGGGGGGLGAPGGAGGRAGSEALPRAGGAGGQPSNACPGPTLVPLVGGSGGGAGGVGDVNGGPGGGGGGALQLSSFARIQIDSGNEATPAVVRASGAGGAAPTTAAQGGGGGGSGGSILLEAPVLLVATRSSITANGGGGGSGVLSTSVEGADGMPGTTTETRAAGGNGNEDDEGFGGVGGARSGAASTGGRALDGSGGGGGGVGIIRINRRTQTIAGGAVISPAHTEGALAVQ
jgi:hypothetical protein